MPDLKKIAVIFNPGSGSSDQELAESVRQALQRQQCPFDWHDTTPAVDAGQLAAAAVKAGTEQIIVAGGDGTVMAAVNGVGKTEVTAEQVVLSIVPAGTA